MKSRPCAGTAPDIVAVRKALAFISYRLERLAHGEAQCLELYTYAV